MKRVLEVLTHINTGGAETVVYNYLSHMDRTGLQFDVLALEQSTKPFLEDRFKELGIGIYYLPANIIKRISIFKKLIVENRYDIIHSHCEFLSEIYMGIAACHGVKTRIIHSHISKGHYSIIKNLYAPIGKFIAKQTATHYFGCGADACKSQWGKAYDAGKCYVLNNAVDTHRFAFDAEIRECVRKEMEWNNKFVIMNVGRFMKQKNHLFLLDIYKHLNEKYRDTILVLIGEGPLQYEIESKVKDLGLEKFVCFLGRRNDVNRLLNGADVFFLPSLFEGLPVVAVEAQANGLPIVMSNGVTRESGITNIATFVDLGAPIEQWVDVLMKRHNHNRSDYYKIVEKLNFNLEVEANKLREFYMTH